MGAFGGRSGNNLSSNLKIKEILKNIKEKNNEPNEARQA